MNAQNELHDYCQKWGLSSPVLIANTFTSDIYRVRYQNGDAILKLFNENGKKFESKSAAVLRCFNGNGAVQLIQFDEGAHLLEFIDGKLLKSIFKDGLTDQTHEIICEVVQRLHAYDGAAPSELNSMERNFQSLFLRAKSEPAQSVYASGARVAEMLIQSESEIKVLHGDIHHENILKSSSRGWLAIDPQSLRGERTYELANTFYNPRDCSAEISSHITIEWRAKNFSDFFKINRRRILEYAFAYGCLSAAWSLEDGQSPEGALKIAAQISQILGN